MSLFTFPHTLREDSVELINLDVLDALKTLPEHKFKLIVSSPPYNIGKSYEHKISLDAYLEWQKEVITEMARCLHTNGSIVWQVGNYVENKEVFPLDMYFYPLFKALGFKLRNRIIWHFNHGLHCSNRLSGRYETLLWFTKSDSYTFNLDPIRIPSKYPGKLHYKGAKAGEPSGNPLGKNPSDFWELIQAEFDIGIIDIPNVKSNHPEKTSHPCQFPVELIERCILAFTNEHDTILDPFCGVGSSLIAAIKNNRYSCGIDRDPDYIEFAASRVKAYLNGELKLRPLGKPIHQPKGTEKITKLPEQWLSKDSVVQGRLL